MHNILLVTVGGSPAPIITAIQRLEPARVIFICSDGKKGSKSQVTGTGKPCTIRHPDGAEEKIANLPTHLGIADRFDEDHDVVLLDDPDDLAACYRTIARHTRLLPNVDGNITVDYTGGTKTMSAALALVAIDLGLNLFVTTAVRKNLVKVTAGEVPLPVSSELINVDRKITFFLPSHLGNYDYTAAVGMLDHLLSTYSLSGEDKRRVQRLHELCKGFDAWDKFDHVTAWVFLENQMDNPHINTYGLFLRRVIGSRAAIDSNFCSGAIKPLSGHGFEIVEDLLLNAGRRAHQKRFDDAVGRVYRALELLCQIQLRVCYGIDTGDVDPGKLPDSMHDQLVAAKNPNSGKIQLGLIRSYRLLSALPDDPIGKRFSGVARKVEGFLRHRNNSLFAHGFTPVSESDYATFKTSIETFIITCIRSAGPDQEQTEPQQFPTDFD